MPALSFPLVIFAVVFFGSALATVLLVSRARRRTLLDQLQIEPLSAADAAQFSWRWNTLQDRLVDNPRDVVAEADHLVVQLLEKQGYPMDEFERGAKNICIDHPNGSTTHLTAQTISIRPSDRERSEAEIKVLRNAVAFYHRVFKQLFGAASVKLASPRGFEPRFSP